ncbi:winged helix DNA-binding domain-containing protein [Streptomyces sp. ASQP_92]|uniref:winged helix DNA-binding domain-containing protein n=1 Tax=Streptomyces sp. ASQP_92 TaxID=2979116 RepID=UPI0021C0BC62|nr:winged helix DNA-binding domain-containing protein [Streptomyces sp. ASQP_92]MCT9092956.1 winged helix DNA-binding domain-containing protein [Streptomyces sp. ASQP_92]
MAHRTGTGTSAAPPLSRRALNRATLDRQLLLKRSDALSPKDAVAHLLGLQAQNVKPPYFALWSRLAGFRPEALSELMEAREVVRMVTLRSTIHTHTADDALTLRPLVQAARDRELNAFRKGLVGVDTERLGAIVRALVEERPYSMKELREALLKEWPDADPFALSVAARCVLPLVQVTPRGLWGRGGQVALTTVEHWLGRSAGPVPAPDATVLRYLGAFGPASVKDMQTWSGLTRLGPVFARLRPELAVFRDENGVELFDLPDASRPDEDTPAPPRFLPEFDNLLLSHADRARVVPPEHKGRAWSGNQAHRTLLVDGFLAGIWRVEERKDGSALLTVQLFEALGAARRGEVAEEAGRLLADMTRAASYDVRFGEIVGNQG